MANGQNYRFLAIQESHVLCTFFVSINNGAKFLKSNPFFFNLINLLKIHLVWYCGGGINNTTKQKGEQQSTVCIFSLYGRMTVGTKRCICASICVPPRMRSNAVGGRLMYSGLGVGWCSYDASTGLPPGLEVGGLEV